MNIPFAADSLAGLRLLSLNKMLSKSFSEIQEIHQSG